MWACGKSHCQRPMSTEEIEANINYLNKGRDPSVSFVLMGVRTRLQLHRDFSHYVVKC